MVHMLLLLVLRYLHLLYLWPAIQCVRIIIHVCFSKTDGISPIQNGACTTVRVLVERNRPNLHRGDVHRLLPPRERFIDNSKLVLYHSLGHLLPIRGERRFCIGWLQVSLYIQLKTFTA